MKEKFVFKKPLDQIINNKLLLILLLFITIVLFPLIIIFGSIFPIIKK